MSRDVVIPPTHVDAIWGTCAHVDPAGTEHNHLRCDCPNCPHENEPDARKVFYRCVLAEVWLTRDKITETRKIGMH